MNAEYIVGIGEALWDCLPDGRKLGGAPANFAYHVSQFGYNSMAVSALGNDALGDDAVAAFQAKGLRHLMPRTHFPTGTVQVSLDAHGVPSYDICQDVAWDNIPFTPEMRQLAGVTRCVCWGSLAQRSPVSRGTIASFIGALPDVALKIFDINLRQHFYSREVVEDSLNRCNVLKINDEELEVLGTMLGCGNLGAEDRCRHLLRQWHLDLLVLTCGAAGSYVFGRDEMSFIETARVEVADTVGAGDSFTAAFAACILACMPVAQAHRRAVEVSAWVCTQNGAMPRLPRQLTAL